MRFKPITWRFWAIAAGCLAAYIGLGYWWSSNGTVEEWVYRLGLTAASVIPALYVSIYTFFGLQSERLSAKWWVNPLGAVFVLCALGLIPLAGPLAIAFWWYGGALTPTWLAWIAVSGPGVSALAWMGACWVWIRIRLAELRAGDGNGHSTRPETPSPAS